MQHTGHRASDEIAQLRALLEVERGISKKLIAERDKWFEECHRLRDALYYVLEDEENGCPRASSSCREEVRRQLAE